MSQRALIPGAGFAGPRLEPDALISVDGARLPMTVWPAEGGEPWAVILGLHGMNDYAEAFTLAGPAWAKAGVTTYAYDQRGFGRGEGRGVWGGEALMVEDIRIACTLARARHPKAILAVVGESMGGAVAIAAFASDRPPVADRLVLLSPAVWGWGEQPLPNAVALWLGAHIAPSRALEPPSVITRHIRATDNIEILRKMSRDRNLIFSTRIDAIYGLVGLMQDAQDRIGAVKAPTLYCYGAHDQIIPSKAAKHAAAKLGPNGRTAWYAEGWHILNRDLQRQRLLDDALAFIRDPNAALPSGAPPIPRR
jgi:alpha-beta hydrolase superfamily lysophospholipase